MTIMPLLYWIILILSIIGYLAPATWPSLARFGPSVVLFVIIGLKYFRIPLTVVALSLILAACSSLTPQQSALLAAARPIATAALTAAAAQYGVSPGTTQAALAAADSLYGAAAQAQAGQPVAAGAATPAIGQVIAAVTPAGTPNAKAALLQAAATSIKP